MEKKSKGTLKIAAELSLPVESATQKLAWLGTTGSGKTYGASKYAEQLWHKGAQFVVLDPVGVWYGLRLQPDGKKPSEIDIPIFGGLHGDLPIESTSGKVLADLIVEKNLSAILDVSQFESDAAKARFAADFADRFFFLKKAAPSAVHLFIEECQEFVPQNPQRGEERMLHAFTRMQKLGRNFGIGSSYITQRPQDVSKKALNMAQTLFVFRATGKHERAAIEQWIQDKSLDLDIAADLPKIPTGQCHVWSPEFLKISEMVHILQKETFNASATPEVGKKAKARSLAAIDLQAIKQDIAEVVAQAEKDDPVVLRKRITELEKIAGKPAAVITAPAAPMGVSQWREYGKTNGYYEYFEKQVLAEANKIFETERATYRFALTKASTTLHKIAELTSRPDVLEQVKEALETRTPPPAVVGIDKGPGPDKTVVVQAKVEPSGIVEITDVGEIDNPQQRVLDGIAWMEKIGITQPAREIVAFLAGYAHLRSKGFTNPCSALRSKGLIEYPPDGKIALTEAGRAAANFPDHFPTNQELQDAVMAKLDNPKQRVLKPLLDAYPKSMTGAELAAAASYGHERSKGYTNPRSALKSFGLIDYPSSGVVRASSLLFPDGGFSTT